MARATASDVPAAWRVYIVRCADGSLYTGIARDLAARIARHNDGKASRYTRARRPVELVYAERAADRAAALRREHAIKRLRAAEKRALVAGAGSTRHVPAAPQPA